MLLTELAAGLIMGFASSLHCAGMCGPIACAMLLVVPGRAGTSDPMVSLMLAQGGKLVSYAMAGAAFGVFGAGLYGLANLELAHSILQWSAAISIIWIGLSVAGLVPALAGLDGVLAPVAGFVSRQRRATAGGGYPQFALAGLLWGLTPCAMVYTALFNSLLTGSVAGGTTLMIGFGLGTIPSITLSALGLFRLRRVTGTPRGRLLAGLGLASAGILGLLLTAPGSPLCIVR